MVAVGLPIILIIVIAVVAFLPRYINKPQLNFVYTADIGSRYYDYNGSTCTIYKKYYEIDSATNKIVAKDYYVSPFSEQPEEKVKEPCQGYATIFKDAPEMYLYDFTTEKSSLISPEALSQLTIVSQRTSPDGYQVSYRYGHNGVFELFGSSDDRSNIYLIKDNPLRKLNLEMANGSYYGDTDFRFIGWVR